MMDKLREMYENEYKTAVWWVNSEHCKTYEDKVKNLNFSLQRCLGAAFFIQYLGASFEEVDAVYEEYRKKFMDLFEED
jgi:hypothetical protein